MAKKYHISPETGEVKICRATRKCPIGGEHFDSEEAANKYIEQKYESKHTIITSHSKREPTQQLRVGYNNKARIIIELNSIKKKLLSPNTSLDERVEHMQKLQKLLKDSEFNNIKNTPIEHIIDQKIDSLNREIGKKDLDKLLQKASIKQVHVDNPYNHFYLKYPVGTKIDYKGNIFTIVENDPTNYARGKRSLAVSKNYDTLEIFESSDDSDIKVNFKPEIMNTEIKDFRENHARNSMLIITSLNGKNQRIKIIDNDGVDITFKNLDTNDLNTYDIGSFKNNYTVSKVIYQAPYKSPSDIAKEAKETFTKNTEFELYDDNGNASRVRVIRNSNSTIAFEDTDSGKIHYVETKDLVNGDYTYINLTERKREEENHGKGNNPLRNNNNISETTPQKIISVTNDLQVNDRIKITDSQGFVVANNAYITYNDGVEVYYSSSSYNNMALSDEAVEINHWTIEKV